MPRRPFFFCLSRVRLFGWALALLPGLLCLSALPVMAHDQAPGYEILRRIAAANSDVLHLGGSFTQTRRLAILKQPLVSTGTMFFILAQETGQEAVRWEYTAPQKSGFIYKHGKAYGWIEDHKAQPLFGQEAVFVQRMAEQIGVWTAINPDELTQRYEIHVLSPTSIELVPYRRSIYTKLRACFAKDLRGLLSLCLYDEDGSTLLEFSHITFNGPIPADLH